MQHTAIHPTIILPRALGKLFLWAAAVIGSVWLGYWAHALAALVGGILGFAVVIPALVVALGLTGYGLLWVAKRNQHLLDAKTTRGSEALRAGRPFVRACFPVGLPASDENQTCRHAHATLQAWTRARPRAWSASASSPQNLTC
jgi:hypothetical protein